LIIVVSHDRENAEKYADRIIELKDGRIIDDVSKGGGAEYEGIKFTDGGVYIKAGYSLTPADTENINRMMRKASAGVLISFDPELNKKYAPEESAKGALFTKTEEVKTLTAGTGEGGEKFRLIKSRYPFKDSLKMGASGLTHKRVRLAFTIILSFIAFTLFGLSDTMAAFDEVKTFISSVYDNDMKVVSVRKEYGYDYIDGRIMWSGSSSSGSFSNADYEKIDRLVDAPLYSAYPIGSSIMDNLRDYQGYDPYENIYPVGFSSTMEFDSAADLENLDLTLVAGAFPGNGEILISDFIAESFVHYGYCERKEYNYPENSMPIEGGYYGGYEATIIGGADINSYSDLIGRTLTGLGADNLVISGVVKTQIDFQKYKADHQENPFRFFGGSAYDLAQTAFVKSGQYVFDEGGSVHGSALFFKLDLSRAAATSLLKKLQSEEVPPEESAYVLDTDTRVRYTLANSYTSKIDTFKQLVFMLKKVFLYLSLILSLFCMLLFMNFIGTSVANKKKEIGILRAIGARGIDVYGIFFNESMLIALINVALAVAGTFVGAYLMNNIVTLPLIVVGIRQIGFIALIAAGVAALGSFLPIYRFAKKKPIETITDR